jgi:two-component sensor histidine kinase
MEVWRKTCHLYTLLLLTLWVGKVYAQDTSKVDTAQIDLWYQEGAAVLQSDTKHAQSLVNKAWKESNALNYVLGIGDGYYFTGRLYEQKGEFEVAISYYEGAIKQYKQHPQAVHEADAYLRLGLLNGKRHRLFLAYQYYHQGYEIAQRYQRFEQQIALGIELAKFHLYVSRNYDSTVEHLNAIRDLHSLGRNRLLQAEWNLVSSQVYQRLMTYEVAYDYGLTAQSQFKSLEVKSGYLRSLLSLAMVQRGWRNAKEMGKLLAEAKDLLEGSGVDQVTKKHYAYLMADWHYLEGRLDEAYAQASQLNQEILPTDVDDYVRAVKSLLIRVEYARGHTQQADVLFSEYQLWRDRYFREQYNEQGAELNEQFMLEKLERQIEMQKLSLTNATYQKYGLIGGIILLLIILVVLYFHARQRDQYVYRMTKINQKISKQNEVLQEANNQNEYLLREIHHRVKNNLQIINSLLSLQSRKAQDPQVLDALNQSRSRLNAIALVHNKLYRQQNLERLDMQTYIEQLADHLLGIYHEEEKAISIVVKANKLQFPIDTAIPLGLMITELITNSLQYALEDQTDGAIWITIQSKEEGHFELVYSDNGEERFLATYEEDMHLSATLIQLLAQQLEGAVKNVRGPSVGYLIQFKAA